MIDYDLSRRPGRPSEWQALATAILASTEPEENYWLEAKSRLDWSKDHGVGTLAKAVLALANRDPGRAANALEGRGVVIVSEVEALDNADLDNKLTTFVGGSDGPRWEPHWVRVDDKPVLLIEVDAPRNGDPPYLLRQKYDDHGASQVFVRETGKTVVAEQPDIERLARRLVASDAKETLDVFVTADTSDPLSTFYWEDAGVEAFLDAERDRLMVPLAAAQAKAAEAAKPIDLSGLRGAAEAGTLSEMLAGLKGASMIDRLAAEVEKPEPRSAAQYTSEVDAYIESLRAALPEALRQVAASVVPAPIFLLANLSDRNFTDVEVTIRVEGEASAGDAEDRDPVDFRSLLPKRPRAFGPFKVPGPLGIAGRYPIPAFGLPPQPYVPTWRDMNPGRRDIRNGGSFEVDFDAVDLRPRQKDVVIESYLAPVIPRHRTDPVIVYWHATASNVNAVANDSFELPFVGAPIDVLAVALRKR